MCKQKASVLRIPAVYERGTPVQGYLAHKTPPSYDPTVALCRSTYGDPRGVGVSSERGKPAALSHSDRAHILSDFTAKLTDLYREINVREAKGATDFTETELESP